MTYFWHHDQLFDVMTNVLLSNDEPFVIMTCFWHHDELFDVMAKFLTSWYVFDIMKNFLSFLSHDELLSRSRHGQQWVKSCADFGHSGSVVWAREAHRSDKFNHLYLGTGCVFVVGGRGGTPIRHGTIGDITSFNVGRLLQNYIWRYPGIIPTLSRNITGIGIMSKSLNLWGKNIIIDNSGRHIVEM